MFGIEEFPELQFMDDNFFEKASFEDLKTIEENLKRKIVTTVHHLEIMGSQLNIVGQEIEKRIEQKKMI